MTVRRRGSLLALVALLVLVAGCSQGDDDGAPPPSSGGPTVVVDGEPVPMARMTDALANLCTAREEATDRPRTAEARFFDRSHETLHVIARALEDGGDRPVAARLLEAKQKVESDLSGLASGDRVAEDLGRLIEATRAALDRLAVPIPPCAK